MSSKVNSEIRQYTCRKKCCSIEIHEQVSLPRRTRYGNLRKAGVFIYDPKEQKVLLVQSRGHLWGFPKGTLETDMGETPYDCAIREVKEETGIKLDQLNYYININGRAVYYYVEKSVCPVKVQNMMNNDANGIGWINIDCLKELIADGHIVLNHHAKIVFKRFLGLIFNYEDFTIVENKRKKRNLVNL